MYTTSSAVIGLGLNTSRLNVKSYQKNERILIMSTIFLVSLVYRIKVGLFQFRDLISAQ